MNNTNNPLAKIKGTFYHAWGCHLTKKEKYEGLVCFEKAAALGNAKSQYKMGVHNETGGDQDDEEGAQWWYKEANRWYKKAAAQNHREAQDRLKVAKFQINQEVKNEREYTNQTQKFFAKIPSRYGTAH